MTHPTQHDGFANAATAIDAGTAFVRFRGAVYRWACAMGCTHDQGLDAVQEVFLRLVRTEPRPASEHALPAWLRRTTAGVVVDVWRAREARAAREFGAASLRLAGEVHRDGAEAGEAARFVREAVRELSEQQRLVLVCKVVEGLTFVQIAAELGIGVPTAKTHYVRALGAIRERLVEHGLTEVPYAV